MTTKHGATHLHPLEMKRAFVSTCRHMFPNDAPLLELARRRAFTPGFAVLTFANKGALEDGVGMFLFQVMDAEAEGEAAVRRIIRAHMKMDPIAVATSLIDILLKTRDEAPFFAAIDASKRIMGKGSDARNNGRMRASIEFLKACAEDGVGYQELVIGSSLIQVRDDIIDAAAVMGMGTDFDYEGRSLFRGVLAISGLVFEDVGICAPHGIARNALLDDYVGACLSLYGKCINSLRYFADYFAAVLMDRGGDAEAGSQPNWRGGRALIRLFTDESALERIGDAKDDPRGLQLVMDDIAGLNERVEGDAPILWS
ncbi:MAG: hypothetical protein PHQ80_00810 [Candidatus ainarchaeum sp.]|nr:hypothetical protein [Candidatus ainarchaeum sp.]MDD5096123.1 hypothetical protein [Candidatus ainarchaeum sp.]